MNGDTFRQVLALLERLRDAGDLRHCREDALVLRRSAGAAR